MSSFKEYISYLEKDKSGQEIVAMIDCLTTNKTSFFREAHHFDYLQEHVLPSLTAMKKKRIRIWSAGCSTGEEPYTIAIVLRESLDNLESLDVRILATDISTRVLHTAREGIYPAENLEDVPMELRYKYFTKVAETKEGSQYKINENIKALVKFARLNLLDPWPMKGPFDVIFCRNVMIYFDKETQQMLVNRFTDLLGPEGYLFVGHSESLMSINHRLTYVQPAIYKKLRN
jgi:chemotaxis protein methyltransferase CheR